MEVSKKYLNYLALAPLFLVGLYCIVKAVGFEIHDFSNYYFGAQLLLNNTLDSSIYFPHIFNLEIANLGYQNIFVSYAPNTPFLATLFYPLTYFSVADAKLVFNCLSLLLFLYSVFKLAKVYNIRPIFLMILPLVFFIPLRNNFLFGQVYLLMFFLLSEGFLAYKKEAYLKMSVFWSIAILLKVFPILLVGMLLFQKKFKAIGYLGVACSILLGISLLINGYDIWEFYFSTVLPKSGNGEVSREFVQNYQSMFMFLKYLFPTNIFAFSLFILIYKIGLLSIGYIITKQSKSYIKTLSFWIFFIILWSPYGSTYMMLLLIFPFLYFIKDIKSIKTCLAIILLLFFINSIPVSYFSTLSIPFSFPRLWLLLILFLVFISPDLKIVKWKKGWFYLLPLIAIYAVIFLPKEHKESSMSLSKDQILTYDYNIDNGVLKYAFWNNNGANFKDTEVQIQTIDTLHISIKNNQVYFKEKQLTFTKSNKLKPAIINNSELIYLSDFKKGIGFYSLRIMPINSEK